MERRSFIKKSSAMAGSAVAAGTIPFTGSSDMDKDIYELKVVLLKSGNSKSVLKKYYTEAVIPLLNKRGAKVGAFSEYSLEEPPCIYILHAHKSPADYWNAVQDMQTDETFLAAAEEYMKRPASRPVFERYETFLLEAFNSIPHFRMPAKNRGLFEMRTYEGYNEDALRRKVKMFDKEELPLFEEVGLHPLFFGKILAGGYMPALTYMLWFKDMAEREENWERFRTSESWRTMSVKEEYADTVSKVRKIFLLPEDFSQI
jgi:hypothetical protein